MALAGRNRERLNELLSKRHECADSTAQIDQQIRTEFEHRVAILVLDMCQFTEITKLRGIIHYLTMIGHLAGIATPIVEANGGFVVKREADNLFAAFVDPLAALEAALEINLAIDASNDITPDERDIYGCIGIGYGATILVERTDFFGTEVNLACKLGEDFAQAREILITPAAHSALPHGLFRFEPKRFVGSSCVYEAFLYRDRMSSAER